MRTLRTVLQFALIAICISNSVYLNAQISCKSDIIIALDADGMATLTVGQFTDDPCPGCTVDVLGDAYLDVIDCNTAGKRIRVAITIPGEGMVYCEALVKDITPPIFTNCVDITVGCHLDVMTSPVDSFDIIVDDACGIDTIFPIICGSTDGDCISSTKTLKIQWQAIDSSGNVGICMQMVSYIKESLGDVSLPETDTIYCHDASTPPLPPTIGDSVAITPLCGLLVGDFEDDTLSLCGAQKLIRRVWLVLDICTLDSEEFVQEISLLDSVGPSIIYPGNDTLYVDSATCMVNYTLPEVPVVLHCSEDVVSFVKYNFKGSTFIAGDVLGLSHGQDTITVIAANDCWLMDTCTFVITVRDTFPPTLISCPVDTLVAANSPPLENITICDELDMRFGLPAEFLDQCCAVELSCILINAIDAVQDTGFIIRRYIARDTCGNIDSCEQLIRLEPNARSTYSSENTARRKGNDLPAVFSTGSNGLGKFKGGNGRAIVWPNPFSQAFELSYLNPQDQMVDVRIIDLHGGIVFRDVRYRPAGQTVLSFGHQQLSGLVNGVYQLIISTTDKREIHKILHVDH